MSRSFPRYLRHSRWSYSCDSLQDFSQLCTEVFSKTWNLLFSCATHRVMGDQVSWTVSACEWLAAMKNARASRFSGHGVISQPPISSIIAFMMRQIISAKAMAVNGFVDIGCETAIGKYNLGMDCVRKSGQGWSLCLWAAILVIKYWMMSCRTHALFISLSAVIFTVSVVSIHICDSNCFVCFSPPTRALNHDANSLWYPWHRRIRIWI